MNAHALYLPLEKLYPTTVDRGGFQVCAVLVLNVNL